MQRIADQEEVDFVLRGQPRQLRQVRPLIRALQVGETLRGDAQRIADGQADALLSEVERQDAAGGDSCEIVGFHIYYRRQPW